MVGFKPTISMSSPTLTIPRSIRPVTTVPRPEMENTSSTGIRNAPVRFNDKPYRGRIEVFANRRGSLTVVNVIGLEDYVRGVVPNELSYPALEALKAQAVAART